MVPMTVFQDGDVYIDYPFEDARFRYEHATSKVFCRFNSRVEVEVGYTNDLFRDAMRSGVQIDRQQYFGDSTPPEAAITATTGDEIVVDHFSERVENHRSGQPNRIAAG